MNTTDPQVAIEAKPDTLAATQTAPRSRRWATKEEAAVYGRCTTRTLDRRMAEGKLTRFRNGKTVLIDLDELDAMFESAS